MIVVASLGICSALAEPPAQSPSETEDQLPFEAIAREAQAIADAVLANHLDPPTRQEMWLEGTKAMLAKAGVVNHAGLSAGISRLTTPEQLTDFLKDRWAAGIVFQDPQAAPVQKQAFINGMLGIVPGGATFVSRKELTVREQFLGNRYIGTGIALHYDEDKKYPQIGIVVPGGPMERAGGRAGDLILKIDERDAHGLSIEETTDLLRGPEGTSVKLVVGAAANESRTIVVTRGPVVIATLQGLRKDDDGQWDYRAEPYLPICCVKVTQINASTVHELRELERQFRADEVKAVILDLRSSFAPDLHNTLLFADALMDGGVIGRVRTAASTREYRADRECLFRGWPLAVLVNQRTRGGGEWIAAALQDNQMAVIVGEPTAGIADVRTFVRLPGNEGAVELNSAIFERPKGMSLAKIVNPNPARSRPQRASDETEQASGGVIPDLPKSRAPAPVFERPIGQRRQLRQGEPVRARQPDDSIAGEVRRQMPNSPELDEASLLRIAVLELRTRLEAGEERNPR